MAVAVADRLSATLIPPAATVSTGSCSLTDTGQHLIQF
jgi:hypothetical protein